MPRQTGIFVENNFVRGLVTEATALSFPENACTETFDCIFKKTGEVVRRKGLEYEFGYALFDLTTTAVRSASAITTYLWSGAGGDGDSSFLCVQIGQYIYFYPVGDSLSPNLHATTVDLDDFDVAGTTLPFSYPVDFAQGDGKLFVVGKFIEPFYVTWTPSTSTMSAGTQITIKTRDFAGIRGADIGLAGNGVIDGFDRPTADKNTDTALANAHLYNLFNQGWSENVYIDGGGTPGTENPVIDWDATYTTLPGNSDRWWFLKNADDQMDTEELDKIPITTTHSPKGHYIFNAFDTDRTAVLGNNGVAFDTILGRSGLTNKASTLYSPSTDYRPSSVAFFSSRVWYAGVEDEGYNNKIYFSQILDDIQHAGHCYQEQDPTSPDLYDLLPTDGGVIEIPEIANVVSMFATKNTLYVFATNGIWAITGSEGIGFTATDFSVAKISNLQNVKNKSIVDLNGVPAWINSQGIWLLQEDQALGSPSVTSLSKDSIQTFFEDIPAASVPYITGAYNQRERIVYWLYRSTVASSLDGQYQYDRVLCFNTETGAFYPWKLNTSQSVKVLGVGVSKGYSTATSTDNVIDSNTNTVIDSSSDTVVASVETYVAVPGTTKFLVENASSEVTWAEAWESAYVDWSLALGTGRDYTSYFITGYKVRGEGLRTQQTGYVRIHSRVETNSSLRVQGVWDTYTSDGARWSTEQEAYKARSGAGYTERRLKIRGNGLALQIRFSSRSGRPFNCIGWSSEDSISVKP